VKGARLPRAVRGAYYSVGFLKEGIELFGGEDMFLDWGCGVEFDEEGRDGGRDVCHC
jgi:hypothetical protein